MNGAENVHELAAGYALDALDPDERERFIRHLDECERCRAELESFETTTGALALAAIPAEPPAELRSRLIEQAREERSNVIPLRPRRVRVAPVWAAAAVAACVAVAFGIWAVSLSRSLNREQDARRAQERALALVAEPGSRQAALQGATGLLVRQSSGAAALIVSRLRPAPHGKSYEAWVVMRPGVRPLRAGVFSGGGDLTVVELGPRLSRPARVAVTVERQGGVNAPTSRPVFGAKLA